LVSKAVATTPSAPEVNVKEPTLKTETKSQERKFHYEEGINPATGKKARRKVYE